MTKDLEEALLRLRRDALAVALEPVRDRVDIHVVVASVSPDVRLEASFAEIRRLIRSGDLSSQLPVQGARAKASNSVPLGRAVLSPTASTQGSRVREDDVELGRFPLARRWMLLAFGLASASLAVWYFF